ncbi:type II secretion system protein GspM, partial [Hyphomonas sp.]|uniref:type II secretion system protein GspM n=1 Tax=Hyphomonas sp. TaxID=87 RepID=UPI003918B101
MIQFWSSRSPRERMLILAAAVIVGLLLLSTSVVRPLRAAHLEASTMLLKSASTLELVDQAAQSARAEGKARPRLSDAELRTALVELARRRGIEISRLQTRDDGNIVLQIETAPAPLVFA